MNAQLKRVRGERSDSSWLGGSLLFGFLSVTDDFWHLDKQVAYLSLIVEGVDLVLRLQPFSELLEHRRMSQRATACVIHFHPLAPHLICLGALKLLELALEAHIGGGTGPGGLHRRERVTPAQPCHRHDVGDH